MARRVDSEVRQREPDNLSKAIRVNIEIINNAEAKLDAYVQELYKTERDATLASIRGLEETVQDLYSKDRDTTLANIRILRNVMAKVDTALQEMIVRSRETTPTAGQEPREGGTDIRSAIGGPSGQTDGPSPYVAPNQ